MLRICIGLFVAVALADAAVPVVAVAEVDGSAVLGRVLALKPDPERLAWKRIPWLSNLAEARQAAAKEKRPLLIWGSDDDPLDRC